METLSPGRTDRPDGTSPKAEAGGRAPSKNGARRLPGWAPAALEIVASFTVALGFLLWIYLTVRVNPMVRIGQVSGLADLQLKASIIGLPILGVLTATAFRGPLRRFKLVRRLACAALAGLASGMIGGGIAIMLNGTPWALGAQSGDPGGVQGMALEIMNGHLPNIYPPGFPAAVAGWAELFRNGHVGYAMKDLQLLCSALAGPVTYVVWRRLLSPVWALVISATAVVVFLDPIRPYSHQVMFVLLPLAIIFLRGIGRLPERTTRDWLIRAVLIGAAFGLLFLWYSGWFLWSLPGLFVLLGFLIPWRSGKRALVRVGAYIGATALGAVVVAAPLVWEVLRFGASTPDRFAYYDVYLDPSYVMGWHTDRPGVQGAGTWIASTDGSLAGQSAFTLLLLFAVALAVALGLRMLVVRATLTVLVSAWLMRFWFAAHMAQTQSVQLYPRTTWLIMYCLIILAVMGIMLTGRAVLRILEHLRQSRPDGGPVRIPATLGRRLAAAAVCVTALFGTMGASWSVNRYMPVDPSLSNAQNMGVDAWRSQTKQTWEGGCSRFAPEHKCSAPWITTPPLRVALNPLLYCSGINTDEWFDTCGHSMKSATTIPKKK
ncbi:hypothetical protein ABIA33_000316 [Streptacidiphilus sp. MAP12-16]|uniref:hypothetical protein n=1 Tax=Streptacidiphilus sp. MAP12-16 TaxID=3156300 RepID=UPI0035181F9B